jgi:hypothetical protein
MTASRRWSENLVPAICSLNSRADPIPNITTEAVNVRSRLRGHIGASSKMRQKCVSTLDVRSCSSTSTFSWCSVGALGSGSLAFLLFPFGSSARRDCAVVAAGSSYCLLSILTMRLSAESSDRFPSSALFAVTPAAFSADANCLVALSMDSLLSMTEFVSDLIASNLVLIARNFSSSEETTSREAIQYTPLTSSAFCT